jgi:hypothetical protein
MCHSTTVFSGLYAQVDRKLNGDLSRDGNSPYKNQIPDLNGSTMYSSGNMYLQSYPSYDDGYGHQHSPLGNPRLIRFQF